MTGRTIRQDNRPDVCKNRAAALYGRKPVSGPGSLQSAKQDPRENSRRDTEKVLLSRKKRGRSEFFNLIFFV